MAHVYPADGQRTDNGSELRREGGCPVVSTLPGNRGVSCGPSPSRRPAGYLLSLWKKTLHKTTRGKIRGDIIHDLNLPDDGIIR